MEEDSVQWSKDAHLMNWRAVLCNVLGAVSWSTLALGAIATIMWAQIAFHLIKQLHHNDNYIETACRMVDVDTTQGKCTIHSCDSKGKNCKDIQVDCPHYNVTWCYDVGDGFDLGGRKQSVKAHHYCFNEDLTDDSVPTNYAQGRNFSCWYDPSDPWNIWFELDVTHKNWAITTTFFLSLYAAMGIGVTCIGCWSCMCWDPSKPEALVHQPLPRPIRRAPRVRRPAPAPRVELAALPPEIIVIDAPPPYTQQPSLPPPPYAP